MPDDLSALLKAVRKELKGAVRVESISELVTPYEDKLSSGLMSLDLKMKGGYPRGTLVQLHGADGAGKNLLAYMCMAEAQRRFGDKFNGFILSFGYKPDRSLMRLCGVHVEKNSDELLLEGVNPKKATIKQKGKTVGNIITIDLGDDASAREKPSESVLAAALKFIESGKFHVGIIDELGSGETRHHRERKLTDDKDVKVATWASLMSDFLRRYYTCMRLPLEDGGPNKTLTLMLNPQRANIGGYAPRGQQAPPTMTSGYALKHAKAIDLHVRSGSQTKKSGVKYSKDIVVKISKGKHGVSEGAEVTLTFVFNVGVDTIADLVNTAKLLGSVHNKGRYWYVLDYEDQIEGGFSSVIDVIREDPDLQEEIKTDIASRIKHGNEK